MADRTFVGTLDQRFEVKFDVVVLEVGDGFGILCDVVEFSHEEKRLESPIDTAGYGSALTFGISACLEIIQTHSAHAPSGTWQLERNRRSATRAQR